MQLSIIINRDVFLYKNGGGIVPFDTSLITIRPSEFSPLEVTREYHKQTIEDNSRKLGIKPAYRQIVVVPYFVN